MAFPTPAVTLAARGASGAGDTWAACPHPDRVNRIRVEADDHPAAPDSLTDKVYTGDRRLSPKQKIQHNYRTE
jgi:hypothetical protein